MIKKRSSIKSKADKLFSSFIRSIGYCEWCLKQTDGLECAHIFSRRFLITRWDPINALSLCHACHRKWHDKPVEAVEWVKVYLGYDVYNELRYKAKCQVDKFIYDDLIEKIQGYRHCPQEIIPPISS